MQTQIYIMGTAVLAKMMKNGANLSSAYQQWEQKRFGDT